LKQQQKVSVERIDENKFFGGEPDNFCMQRMAVEMGG
jgi:hypothetical protein